MSIGDTCYNETELITKEGYQGSRSWPTMMRAVESTLSQLTERGLNVQLINITQLSEYRKEAHPTIYRKIWHNLTEEEISDPRRHADCFHWCLPGVPDTWNELLYARIFRHSQHRFD
ncbi:PC-Esterase [Dillenia turbinata]|uniref:PC-Esterase n=1 Tax=Dillenia turbinata TaxID=194707 RepID=A0AAN8VZ31_9MAGN